MFRRRKTVTCLEDFRDISRSRIPKLAFDFIDGGAGTESAVARNSAALSALRLVPRVLTGCEHRSIGKTLFGVSYSAPLGVAPTGMSNMAWPGADRAIAAAAEAARIPYIISTPATSSLEALSSIAPTSSWFQLYVGRDEHIAQDLVNRAEAAGISVLVVSVDTPVPGKRLRDIRNGLVLPLRLRPTMFADLLLHPAWSLATARAGPPRFANLERYEKVGASGAALSKLMAAQSSARFDWSALKSLRHRWRDKPLIVKGIAHPDDARKVLELGADGIVVSNHGGRQLDSSPASIESLGPVVDAIAGRIPVLFDGGVRSGEDIAKALATGASFVLTGRPFLFSVAALGPKLGPPRCIDILKSELENTLGQLGCLNINGLNRGMLGRSIH